MQKRDTSGSSSVSTRTVCVLSLMSKEMLEVPYLTRLLGEGIIDENDLEGFTPELREKASFFVRK